MYSRFIRPLLFLLPPETAHTVTMAVLRWIFRLAPLRKIRCNCYEVKDRRISATLLGLTFPNRVGLAAGFDKDARYVDALACLGFGFIEIGTVTPKPQPGNEKPRLFRLPKDKALINRMGFNNKGVLAAVEQLKKRKSNVIVGANIGKNKNTPNEKAFDDYAYCVQALYPYVDYFAVNVSSPNTPGLRELQEKEPLRNLLAYVKALASNVEKPRPVLLKIAPDLTVGQLDDVIKVLKETKTDGVIATNTTVSRQGLRTSDKQLVQIGAGGLSGEPLREKSTEIIRYLRSGLGPHYPIIGVGGIMTPEDALEKLKAGANLVQLYTGFVYKGPELIRQINQAMQSAKDD